MKQAASYQLTGYHYDKSTQEFDYLEINGEQVSLSGDVALENNKAVTLSVLGVNEVTPTAGKDAMKKVTATVAIALQAWKHSSDIIYTNVLPTEAGSTPVIVPAASGITKATGTFATATPEVKSDIWKMGDDFFTAAMAPATEPEGTAGTPVDLGDAVTYVIGGTTHWYQVETSGDDKTYTEITAFGKAAFTLGEVVSDAEVIAVLDTKTPAEVDYIEYTVAATNDHITYSAADYDRYTTGDITL